MGERQYYRTLRYWGGGAYQKSRGRKKVMIGDKPSGGKQQQTIDGIIIKYGGRRRVTKEWGEREGDWWG
jgi:hypothetical protein